MTSDGQGRQRVVLAAGVAVGAREEIKNLRIRKPVQAHRCLARYNGLVHSASDDRPGMALFAVVVATLALAAAALEIWVIVDGISYQPRNCHVEASVKRSVLGVFGSLVLLLSLATAAYAALAARRGTGGAVGLCTGLAMTILAFLFWGFTWIATSGC